MRQEEDLRCTNGHLIPIIDGYIDALLTAVDEDSARTFKSFGYEWKTFNEVTRDDGIIWKRVFGEVPLEKLADGIAIDVGCGNGAFAHFTAPHVKALIALDASMAVRSAASNLHAMGNVAILRADLREAPLKDRSFDFVYCIGVLHHLSDPRAGFQSVSRLIAPNGIFLLFVYSRPSSRGGRALALALLRDLRWITTRMPPMILRVVSAPLAFLAWAGVARPGRLGEDHGPKFLAHLPLRRYRRLTLRQTWLHTFDLLSAPLEARYVWSEIEPWFGEAGLAVDSVRDDSGLFVLAHRPAAEG
jgi:SAM-dependent methyltransferase